MKIDETARVLRNRGVPIRLARLDEDGEFVRNDADEVEVEEAFLRFDSNVVAEIEEAFDGILAEVAIVAREPLLDEAGEAVKNPEGSKVIVEKEVSQEMRPHYGVDAFAVAMTKKPGATVRDVVAIALYGEEWRSRRFEVGRRILPEDRNSVSNAVGIAWAIANGTDPTIAAKMLQKAEETVDAATAAVANRLDDLFPELPGESGSESGSEKVEISTPSGG